MSRRSTTPSVGFVLAFVLASLLATVPRAQLESYLIPSGGVPVLYDTHHKALFGADLASLAVVSGGSKVFASTLSTTGSPSSAAVDLLAIDPTLGQVLWTVEFDDLITDAGQASRLAADVWGGRVFLLHEGRRSIWYDPDRVTLRAFSGVDGSELWSWDEVSFVDATVGGLAVGGYGTLIYSTHTEQAAGGPEIRATCRFADDGAVLWDRSWSTGTVTSTLAPFVSASDDGSLVAVGWSGQGTPAFPYGIQPLHEVSVFHGLSGATLWSLETGAGPVELARDGSLLATVDDQGRLGVFDGSSGAALWQSAVSGSVTALAIGLAGGVVIAAVDADPLDATSAVELVAHQISDGAELWSLPVAPWGPGAPQEPRELAVSADGTRVALHLVGGAGESLALLVDVATGAPLGNLPPGGGLQPQVEPQAAALLDTHQALAFAEAAGALLVSGSVPGSSPTSWDDLRLEGLALASGQQLAGIGVDDPIALEPDPGYAQFSSDGEVLFLAGVVFAPGAYVAVIAQDATTGEQLWAQPDGTFTDDWTGLLTDFAVAPSLGDLFVGLRDGNIPVVRCLEPATGAERWRVTLPGSVSWNEGPFLLISEDGARLHVLLNTWPPTLVTLDVTTGNTLWSAPSVGSSAPLVSTMVEQGAKLVVIGTEFLPGSGGVAVVTRVASFDSLSGTQDWVTDLIGEHYGVDVELSAGRVYVLTRVQESWSYQGYAVHVLDANSGTQLFHVEEAGGPKPRIGTHLALSEPLGLLLVGGHHLKSLFPPSTAGGAPLQDAFLLALDPATGAEVFESTIDLDLRDVPFGLELSPDGATAYLSVLLKNFLGSGYAPPSTVWTGAFDLEQGGLVWSTAFMNGQILFFSGHLAVAPTGDVVCAVGNLGSGPYCHGFGTPPLIGAPAYVSLSMGGSQVMALRPGLEYAAEWHFLLGSASGTAPGIPAGPYTLPLNFDSYLGWTARSPGVPLANALGVLSPTGAAQAAFKLPAGTSPSLAGLELNHAYVTIRFTAGVPAVTSASNAVAVTLTP